MTDLNMLNTTFEWDVHIDARNLYNSLNYEPFVSEIEPTLFLELQTQVSLIENAIHHILTE